MREQHGGGHDKGRTLKCLEGGVDHRTVGRLWKNKCPNTCATLSIIVSEKETVEAPTTGGVECEQRDSVEHRPGVGV
jgi:hypothetical protein